MLVLLDRDGVINADLPTGVLKFEDFVFLPRAIEGIAKLTKAGFSIAVCTNQLAIEKGTTTREIVEQVHDFMCAEVAKAGGKIDVVYYADATGTRNKPNPAMLIEAMERFNAAPARTVFVGDDVSKDMHAAFAAGCPRILVRTGKGAKFEAEGIPAHLQPVQVVDDVCEAADVIISHPSPPPRAR